MRVHVRVKTIEDKIYEYVDNNSQPIYIDYNDTLNDEQIDKILEGKADEVRDEIEFSCVYGDEPSYYEYYFEQLCEEVDCTQDDIDGYLENGGYYPSYYLADSEWRRLLNNTTVNVVGIVFDAVYNFNNWAYGSPIEYSDVKESLKILGVNPAEFKALKTGGSATMGDGSFKGYFPNIPSRVPKINTKDLYDNLVTLYDGVMHFCFGDLENLAAILADDSENIIVKKGTNVVFYDRMNGAGITDVKLTDDVVLKRQQIEFRNDRTNKYGVQECYGFTNNYWTEGAIQSESK